jgi:hypothetical protein
LVRSRKWCFLKRCGADVWGAVTTTHYVDPLGRVDTTTTTPPGGTASTLGFSYRDDGQLATETLDGLLLAQPSYDTAGELASVSYPSGTGNAGNGTSLSAIGKDTAGRPTAQTWTLAGARTMTDTLTRA